MAVHRGDGGFSSGDLLGIFYLFGMKEQEKFESFVLKTLESERMVSLWWMSDFYEGCCKVLELNFEDLYKNQASIRYRLRKMKQKGLIDIHRTGSGFLGKTDFGSTSSNLYVQKGLFDK